jgi:hypothetical protein
MKKKKKKKKKKSSESDARSHNMNPPTKATHLSFLAPPLCISKKLHFTKKQKNNNNNNNKMRFLYIKKYNRYEYDVITILQKRLGCEK